MISPEEISKCRYCLEEEDTDQNPLIVPCQCTGSTKYVHRKCLDQWRKEALNPHNLHRCEICHIEYQIQVKRAVCGIRCLCKRIAAIFTKNMCLIYGFLQLSLFGIYQLYNTYDIYLPALNQELTSRLEKIYVTSFITLFLVVGSLVALHDVSVYRRYGWQGSQFYFRNYARVGCRRFIWSTALIALFYMIAPLLGSLAATIVLYNMMKHMMMTIYVSDEVEDSFVLDIRDEIQENDVESPDMPLIVRSCD